MEILKPLTEDLILTAAQAVFLERGVAGARMQEIADRAGINRALLHYYFRSKEKLAGLIINRAVGEVLPRLMAILATDDDLFEKIRQLAGEYITFLSHNGFLPLFIVNEANRSPQFFAQVTVQLEKPHLEAFRRQVEEAVAQGRIYPISPAQLLMNITSLIVFPFVGKPVFQAALDLTEEAFQQELARRRTDVAEFVIRAIRA